MSVYHNVFLAAKQCASTSVRDQPGHLPNCSTDHYHRGSSCFGLYCTNWFCCTHQATGTGASRVSSHSILWGFLQRIQSEGGLEQLLHCIDCGEMVDSQLNNQEVHILIPVLEQVGCTTLATTVLGCCGQNSESPCTLLTYSVLLLVIACLQVQPPAKIFFCV